jgi:hypothetical protein
VAEIVAAATDEDVPLLLIGGVALGHYGSDRVTTNVDFASLRPLRALPPAQPFGFGGYQSRSHGGVPVGWVIRSDDYEAVFTEAIDNPRTFAQVPAPMVRPEYLVAMKMGARRPKDRLDLAELLRLDVVDIDEALRITQRLLGAYAAADLRGRAAEAERHARP